MIFEDRQSAGEALARVLDQFSSSPAAIVLALPRGGVPVAFQIARALHLPLDILIVRKLGAPNQPELAIGAIAGSGAPVLNEQIVSSLGLAENDIAAILARERAEIVRREQLYRHGLPPLSLEGKDVLLVDDGLATGATMRAAILSIRPIVKQIVVAVPVAPASTIAELSSIADEVVCLSSPRIFDAVGAFYRDFRQTEDAEVRHLLEKARRNHPPANQ